MKIMIVGENMKQYCHEGSKVFIYEEEMKTGGFSLPISPPVCLKEFPVAAEIIGVWDYGAWAKLERIPSNLKDAYAIYEGRISGVTFEGRQDYLAQLYPSGEISVKIVHEPDNPHDKNALAVECEGAQLGYINREDARNILSDIKNHGLCDLESLEAKVIVGFFDKKQVYTAKYVLVLKEKANA